MKACRTGSQNQNWETRWCLCCPFTLLTLGVFGGLASRQWLKLFLLVAMLFCSNLYFSPTCLNLTTNISDYIQVKAKEINPDIIDIKTVSAHFSICTGSSKQVGPIKCICVNFLICVGNSGLCRNIFASKFTLLSQRQRETLRLLKSVSNARYSCSLDVL